MNKDWKKWCRLCGYNKKVDIDNTIKFERSNESVSTAIFKYFGIMISVSSKNISCGRICHMCHNAITSIIRYNEHVLRVNEMFEILEGSLGIENIDINSLREKYGLFNGEEFVYHNEITTNSCHLQIQNSVQYKSDSVDNDSQKYIVKSEKCLNDGNDANNDFLESSLIDELNDKSWSEIETKTEKFINDNLDFSRNDANCKILNIERDDEIKSKNMKKQSLKCEICAKVFQTAKGKTIHSKKKHSVKKNPPFKCNTCGRIFKRFQQLSIHESTHLSENERKYYCCPKCNKKFVSEWYVQDHIRIVHDGDRRFICELCGAAFGTNKNLLDHHLTHSEEKKFHCPKCDKAFKCKRTLKFHVETHDETEYPCHICGLKLNTKRILRRHMLVHSDENKYKCNFCSKEFKRQYEFKNHLLLHIGLKLYQCSFCELTFSNGSNCRKHQKALHPAELVNAESKGTLILVENVPSFKQLIAANEEALVRSKL